MNLKEGLIKQDTLHALEALCTQEEPPACQSTCPVHLDVRSMMKAIGEGDFSKAYTLYSKGIPFGKIIAYSCDHPCENHCKRNEAGGTIRIRDLEKAIVTYGYKKRKKLLLLPENDKKVAIVGGGIRGLTAAYDLAKKGYKITIYDRSKQLGGSLWDLPRDTLPETIIREEIEELLLYPMTIVYNEDIKLDTLTDCEGFLKKVDADILYVSCYSPVFRLGDNHTLVTSNDHILTGSRGDEKHKNSPIYSIYDGRSAATAIDRILKKVSIMAGREKEGPFKTTLFTSLDDVFIEGAIESSSDIYTAEEAILESKRCIQCECLECVKGCPFMAHYKSYPKKYVREVYNNLSIAIGRRHANGLINTCNTCEQCEAICPNGLNMSAVFLAARGIMVDSKKMPQSAHEFAILDMELSNGEGYYLAEHQKGHAKSDYVFFPSCQLGASEPELLEEVYEDLCHKLDGGVGLLLGCCSIMAKWSGEATIFKENINQLRSSWEALGKPQVIVACPTCLKTLKNEANMDAVGIWELFIENNWPIPLNGKDKPLMVHDACGTRYDEKTQKDIRVLAQGMGYHLGELKYTKATSPCCGYGGLTPFVDKALAGEITQNRVEQTSEAFLTYCINCRDRFLTEEKGAYHILELLYDKVPVRRMPPTWSLRQDNRLMIKEKLLKNNWGKDIMEKEQLNLEINPELEALLNDRMIVRRNINDAIVNGEATNEKFCDAKTGYITTAYKPKNVTFWVVYKPKGNGYEVINAYSHRMTFEK